MFKQVYMISNTAQIIKSKKNSWNFLKKKRGLYIEIKQNKTYKRGKRKKYLYMYINMCPCFHNLTGMQWDLTHPELMVRNLVWHVFEIVQPISMIA